VLSAGTFINEALEGRVNFAPAPYQHFGLATGFNSIDGEYWAIFSTGGTADALFARVNANGVLQDVNLGPLPVGFHTYRIEPTQTGYAFYVDGTLKATIEIGFPPGIHARVAISSYDGAPSPALQIERVQVGEFQASSVYLSAVFDAGTSVSWDTANWTAVVPTGTSVQIEISYSNDPVSDWSNWSVVSNGGTLGFSARYLRYRATFTTIDPVLTSKLLDISFIWI
jgi:hypothetical protein